MDNVKKIKKGEVLFKEGDLPQTVYLVQSGKIGLFHERNGNRMEVSTFGPAQVLGESGLVSNVRHAYTAEALQECQLLEVPMEAMKQQYEKSPAVMKILIKSLVEEARLSRQNTKMLKLETEKSPCPQALIHRVFTMLHLVARHIGKKDPATPNQIVLSWSSLKLYISRFFGESPNRFRAILDLLTKLKMATLVMGKSEEGEPDLSEVTLLNVPLLEEFAEFFQYHLFKGSRAEAIFVDPLALKVAKAIYAISEGAEVDFRGASKMDYGKVLSECKAKFSLEIKNIHLDALDKKGLFVKRKSFDDGRIELSFDRAEFGKMSQYWAIIHEIDKWNAKGVVDMNESEAPAASAAGTCAQCQIVLDARAKFCANCGTKIAA